MKTNRLFAILLASATIVGCTNDTLIEHGIENQDMIPINVSSSINQVQTKATAAGFVDKDAVGLYAVNYSNNNSTPGTLSDVGNQADNVKYVFDETNHKWNPVRSVYYKDVNTNVDIYLYYPYRADIDNVGNANFEVQKDQSTASTSTALSGYEASDFLWGKGTNITPVESAVAIEMAHKLSAVQVTLVEKAGFEDGEFENLTKSIILLNTTRKATIDFSTGNATKLGAPQLDGIVMCPQNDGSFRAIVVPQTVPASTKLFSITIDGITYGFSQAEATEYIASKQLNFTINITKKVPSGTYELSLGSTQITDWTEDKNTHGGEARQYFVVNVETPGTLNQVIRNSGKNPQKIRNLKVKGTITDTDFYYMRDSMTIIESINLKETTIMPLIKSYKYFDDYKYYASKYGAPDYYSSDDKAVWNNKGNGNIPEFAFNGKKTLTQFIFPETITGIDRYAFSGTSLAGAIILPESVELIGTNSFDNTLITSIDFGSHLEQIMTGAFRECKSLCGELHFPETLKYIGSSAYYQCSGLSGRLLFPENLEYIGGSAFFQSGCFVGDLCIPEKITTLQNSTFLSCNFKGKLILNNVTNFGNDCFHECGFQGELIIPEGTIEIPENCFANNAFSKIIFPNSLKSIGKYAFDRNNITEPIELNEGLVSIGQGAFCYCTDIPSITLPISLQTIQTKSFDGCYGISSIICSAIEPPTAQSGAFDGVAKDNFTVEVPEQSVIRYQTENGWSDFKRIAGHYDFSLGRRSIRCLNEGISRTYIMRAPSGFAWEVDNTSMPEWITVSPSSGTGKTDVTITVSDMNRTSEMFEVNEGSFLKPKYKNYKGRSAEITFKLTEKEYSFNVTVEQYDYDYADGYVKTIQTASKGPGIDIVYIGEGYDARDIANGTFLDNADEGSQHFFDLEPYKTYKDYFNVYSVVSMSDESGIGTVNTVVANKFIRPDGNINADDCFVWAKKADAGMDISKSLVICLYNDDSYYGWTYMYGDGSALAVVPVSCEAYPCDFRGIIQHEAGGHGFGKLGDEYIYHNAFITTCGCECCEHPHSELDMSSSFGLYKSLGWFKNLSMYADCKQVPWSHLIYHSKYADKVDMYEGGYMHTRGMFRSEATSCMNNNIPYYSAISRQAIVERIKEYAGEEFDFNDFVAKDSWNVGTKAGVNEIDWTFGVDPKWNRGTERGSIIYMGEHPNVQ